MEDKKSVSKKKFTLKMHFSKKQRVIKKLFIKRFSLTIYVHFLGRGDTIFVVLSIALKNDALLSY